tara:strand:+ start:395 stop:709 length:315 start_codon:yes stop_codon:yes gene_type:complete
MILATYLHETIEEYKRNRLSSIARAQLLPNWGSFLLFAPGRRRGHAATPRHVLEGQGREKDSNKCNDEDSVQEEQILKMEMKITTKKEKKLLLLHLQKRDGVGM